jgi:hypothetical protein
MSESVEERSKEEEGMGTIHGLVSCVASTSPRLFPFSRVPSVAYYPCQLSSQKVVISIQSESSYIISVRYYPSIDTSGESEK